MVSQTRITILRTKLQLPVETRITNLKQNYIYLVFLYFDYNTGISDKNCHWFKVCTWFLGQKTSRGKVKSFVAVETTLVMRTLLVHQHQRDDAAKSQYSFTVIL